MKTHTFFVLLSLLCFSFSACERNTENRQGYRQEQEEVTAPNDYSTGKDTKERRQTGTNDRLPIDD